MSCLKPVFSNHNLNTHLRPTDKCSSRASSKKLRFAADGDYYRGPQLVKCSYRLGGAHSNCSICNTTPTPRAWGKISLGQAERVYRIPVGRQCPRGMTGKNTPMKSHALWMPEKTSIMWKQLACQHKQKKFYSPNPRWRATGLGKGEWVASRDELLSRSQLWTHGYMSNSKWT